MSRDEMGRTRRARTRREPRGRDEQRVGLVDGQRFPREFGHANPMQFGHGIRLNSAMARPIRGNMATTIGATASLGTAHFRR
jgi:hypothetical protein